MGYIHGVVLGVSVVYMVFRVYGIMVLGVCDMMLGHCISMIILIFWYDYNIIVRA